jgi:lysophospholipase L1-like esterase
VAWDAVSTAQPGVFSPNAQAILPLSVPAGVGGLDFPVYSTASIGGVPEWGIGFYVDGVWNTNLTPTAGGGLQVLHLPLDGLAHNVDVVTGFVNFQTTGNFLTGYDTRATKRAIAAPTRRFVLYGDSIGRGAAASPNDQLSWFSRSRLVYPGRMAMEAWGGRRLFDDTTATAGGFANVSLLAARLVALAQLGGATTTREIWIEQGYNDYGTAPWTAASFGTSYAALLDAIHAADPTIHIWAQTLLITGTEATVNGLGDLPSAFRTQVTTAVSTRTGFCTLVVGTNLMTAGGLNGDGVHPTTAGHQAIYDGSGAFGGSINVRGVVGF